MESKLFFTHHPYITTTTRFPFLLNTTPRFTNPRLNHGVSTTFKSITCVHGGFSNPSQNKDNKGRSVVATTSLALACVLGVVSLSGYSNAAVTAIQRSSTQVVHTQEAEQRGEREVPYALDGKAALESLLGLYLVPNGGSANWVDKAMRKYSNRNDNKPKGPKIESKTEVLEIKKNALEKMKSGNIDKAVEYLQKQYVKNKKDQNSQIVYELGMVLVEFLIYQGKYQAAQQIDCLREPITVQDQAYTDGRYPLYKAIIYTMLDHPNKALTWWQEFEKALKGLKKPDFSLLTPK